MTSEEALNTINDYNALKALYHMGKIDKLNREEFELLKFCSERDMRKFLKEEFEKHPIKLDDDGGLIGPNPFRGGKKVLTESVNIQNERKTQYNLPNYSAPEYDAPLY